MPDGDTSFAALRRLHREGRWPALNAAVLARVLQEVENQSWALLSIWRPDDTLESNAKRHHGLQRSLHARGLDVVRLVGHYRALGDTITLPTPALLVRGLPRRRLSRLARMCAPQPLPFGETPHSLRVLAPGGSERNLGPFHPGLVAQLYAETASPPLTFVGFDVPPPTWVEALRELTGRTDRLAQRRSG